MKTIMKIILGFSFMIVLSSCNGHINKSSKVEGYEQVDTLFSDSTNSILPLNYSYDFMLNLPDFKPIPEELSNHIHLEGLDNIQIYDMPQFGENEILLVSAYNESGDSYLFMYTLSKDKVVLDSLSLYYAYDKDVNGILGTYLATYHISSEYLIRIEEAFRPFDSTKGDETIVSTAFHQLQANGKFKKIVR